MKMEARVGALESKILPAGIRRYQLLSLRAGQDEADVIAASGFDPEGDFIFLVGMSSEDSRGEEDGEVR